MPPLPLRPLVSVSALALLGWCWFTFRKRRNQTVLKQGLIQSSAKMHSLEEVFAQQDVTDDEDTLTLQDLEVDCQHPQECSSPGPYTEKSLDSGCSLDSSVLSELTLLNGESRSLVITSTPVVRLRPEPEGEVSQAQELPPLDDDHEIVEKNDAPMKGHPDLTADDTEASAKQPNRTNLSENQRKKGTKLKAQRGVSAGLHFEVFNGATEEVTAAGGDILKEKSQVESKETLQSQTNLENNVNKDKTLLVRDVTKIVTEPVASKPKLNEQTLSLSTSQTGEDSGCSSCPSEDGAETPEVHHASSRVHDRLSTHANDTQGVHGVHCVNEESKVLSGHATRPQRVSNEFWDIEVPAHLVGRLIGKNGKHIDFLKQNSGATIYVSTLAYTHEIQICHIEGSQVQVENALALIRKKFKDLDLSNRHSNLQPAALPPVPVTYWLLLPQDRTVEVIVTRVEAANCLFVQQHTHPTYYALCCLNDQMVFCYSHPGCPSLPTPVEAGVLCAAPSAGGGWWRAQVIQHYKDSDTVQIRYLDYGGYVTLDLGSLRQIRSDFVTLPFQATEVMLEKVAPLPGKEEFSFEAKQALEELTHGVPLIVKVTGSQSGLPLVHMWRSAGEEEMISVNGVLVDRGLCSWLDSH